MIYAECFLDSYPSHSLCEGGVWAWDYLGLWVALLLSSPCMFHTASCKNTRPFWNAYTRGDIRWIMSRGQFWRGHYALWQRFALQSHSQANFLIACTLAPKKTGSGCFHWENWGLFVVLIRLNVLTSPSVFSYCKQSKTGWWEGLGMKLVCTHCC